ncbi:MAG: hypothetical protein LBP95_11420 [Deltaproteobacteria bacterium]|nr:hypothetical protein [Deltaproteobacteria bacterium]
MLFSIFTLAATVVVLGPSNPARAQNPASAGDGVEVVSVMGRAEILSAGVWREAKKGDQVKSGESLRVDDAGEATLAGRGNVIEVSVKKGATVSFDGLVDVDSRPWRREGPELRTAGGADVPESGGPGVLAPQFSVPRGQAAVTVVPGQPLRVVAPLVMAAVRGTSFIMTVAADGGSTLNTIEGQVLATSRTGLTQMVGPGQSFSLSANQYASFLQQSGVDVPGDGWRGVDSNTLEQVDSSTFSGSSASEAGQGASGAAQTEASTAQTQAATQSQAAATPGQTSAASTQTAATEAGSTGATTGTSTGATTGTSTGATTGTSTGATTGATTGTTTGASTGASTGATTGASTSASTGATTGATTGASTGAGAGTTTASTAASTTAGGATTTAASATAATTTTAAATTAATTASTLGSIAGAAAQLAPIGGMAAAGISTGALTGEAAEPVTGGSVPLGVAMIDPLTGVPATDFTTDANGEIAVAFVSAGDTQAAMVIDGQTYILDVTAAATATLPPEIVFDVVDFDLPTSNLQSTATLTPNFSGLTVTGTVTWTIVSVVNSTPAWQRGPGDQHGLTWGATANGTTNWTATPVAGTPPTGPVAQLTDIVGERVVTVQASTVISGTTHTKTLTVNFGKGPLAIFTYFDTLPSITFSSLREVGSGTPTNNFYYSSNTSPAAAICGGSLDTSTLTLISGPPHYVNFAPPWETRTPSSVYSLAEAYLPATRLPDLDRLQAIAAFDPTELDVPNRKGAYEAAGVPAGNYHTGRVMSFDANPVYGVQNFSVTMSSGASGAALAITPTYYLTPCIDPALL